jgi:1,4-dihydroxy-2-naphthoyl-CoA synthase
MTKEGGRLAIVLNRPDVANAFTPLQCGQIVAILLPLFRAGRSGLSAPYLIA